jgi:toxin ParE1/3/4
MRLVVDTTAFRDLQEIGAWIAKDNPNAARRVVATILATIERLQYFPRLARPGRARGTFERLVAGTRYIVVFELWTKPAAVVITAVVHGARNR